MSKEDENKYSNIDGTEIFKILRDHDNKIITDEEKNEFVSFYLEAL